MPEIAEVALMADAIRKIASGSHIAKIKVLGGKYKPYHIFLNGQWVNKIKNTKSGRMISINSTKYPGGKYMVALDGLDEITQEYPIKVNSINVKGKYCWIDLDNDWFIGITFGMSGGIYYEVLDDMNLHIKVEMTNGQCFYFGDPRRFGTWIISKDRSILDKKLNRLGHDMLTHTPITNQVFVQTFRQSRFNNKNICKVLMGQTAVSGIGNYIKAEVLYECHINPWALVSDLDDQTLINLYSAIRKVAQNAYQCHGASLYTYTGTRREKGIFQHLLKVYGKPFDPHGNRVIVIPDKKAPDKRTTHYVKEIQIIGSDRDPDNIIEPKIRLKLKIKPKIQLKLKPLKLKK